MIQSRTSFLTRTLALVFLLAGLRTGVAQDRIHSSTSAARLVMPGGVDPRLRQAIDLGAVPDTLTLPAVKLRIGLTAAQTAKLDELLADQQNPASPHFHQWLTPEQYAAEFGLSPNDIASVSTWLEAQGLTVAQVARSRSFIAVSGTAAQFQRAFGTVLHRVSLDGEVHVANLTDPSLPAAIAPVVVSITGLTDIHFKPRLRVHPEYTSSGGSHYLAPGDFYTIYDVNPLLNGSVTGTGITIAVVGQTDISLADVAAFRAAAGLPSNLPTVKLYFSDPGTSSADLDEAQLDVEWSGAIAPGATILYVNSVDVIDDSLTEAIDNDLAPIVAISYGDCEANWGASNLATFNQLFRQANVQGQTIVSGSGDDGATDCDYNVATATNGLAVDYPSSSPYVTSVGGTMFAENGGTYWSAADGAYAGSALSYIPETVWNETATYGALAAGGGGASTYFAKPAFQIGTGVPNDFSRDVPDLALNAGVDHDGYLFCSRGFCTNGFRNSAGQLNVVGGTSVSAQVFAGVLALLEQKIKTSVGNANPTIYGLANSAYAASVFHDIASGSNASPCKAGTTNCPGGGSIGYAAAAGFDLASGWGSIDAFQFISDWPLVTPVGVSSTGNTISLTTLSAPSGTAVAGTSVVLTAAVASGTSGVTAAPTGKVQLLVDNVATGAAATLANATASITLATAGLAAGSHTLTAVYSGDATFAPSKGAIPFTIMAAPTAPDFSLTPATSSTTVVSGGTAPGVVFTVSPLNGFTGNVAFTASSVLSAAPYIYSFNVTPVAITTTASGSTTLTLIALSAVQPQRERFTRDGLGLRRLAVAAHPAPPCAPRGGRWVPLLPDARAFACSSSPSASVSPPVTNTPSGTYSVLVTATAASGGTTVTHNATVSFVVQ